VTNSTAEIGTLKLLSGTKCKIISTGQEWVYGGVEVRLPSLNYKPVAGEWLTARPKPALFSGLYGPVGSHIQFYKGRQQNDGILGSHNKFLIF